MSSTDSWTRARASLFDINMKFSRFAAA